MSNHDPGYRAMDFNDGSRVEIYDETHTFVPDDLEERARLLSQRSLLSLDEARKLLTDIPVVPVVRFHSSRGYGKTTTLEAFEAFGQAWSRLAADIGKALEPLTRRAAESLAPPANAMERALQARKNRNTGPARPSAAQARRPRRHQ